MFLWPLSFLLLMLMTAGPAATAANPTIPAGLKEYTQLEIGAILADGTKSTLRELLAAKVFLQGKISRTPQLKSDEIVLYRMVITCCIADAEPYGVLVKLPGKNDFHDGEWAAVEGTLQLPPIDERVKFIEPVANLIPREKIYPLFTATKAYKITAPTQEYLYY